MTIEQLRRILNMMDDDDADVVLYAPCGSGSAFNEIGRVSINTSNNRIEIQPGNPIDE